MRSTITIKQACSDARMLAKGASVNYSAPTQVAVLSKYNVALQRVYKLLNGAKIARFYGSAPLGSPAAFFAAIASDNKTYTGSTKVITATTVDSTYIGGLVMFSDDSTTYFATITAVTLNTDFTVSGGPTGNIASGSLRYIALKPPSATSYSVASHRIDELRRVHFPTVGNAAKLNEDAFEGLSNNANYDSGAAVVLTGVSSVATIKAYIGSSATNSGGFPVAFFEEKPKVATAFTESVDLPEEFHGPLIEELARMILLDQGINAPKSLENPLMILQGFVDTFQSIKDAQMNSFDKPQ